MSAPLRVLHVVASISPRRGGPSAVVRNMMRALHQRGIAVDVVTTDDDGDRQHLSVPLDTFESLEEQRVRYFRRQTNLYSASWPLLRWLQRNVRDYDVVHTHGLFSFAPLAAAWHARAAGVPYIMRPAGVLDHWGMRNKRARLKLISLRLLERRLLESAPAVHFMSDLERQRAAHLAMRTRPVVLPLGFDFPAETAPEPPALEELAADGRPVILYLSRLHRIKRVDLLLRAFARLPRRGSTVLAIAGDGEVALVDELKHLADELQVSDVVRWLGFASGARKRALLSAASVFVLPSASENFGVAVVEAMNARLPVVVTRSTGLAEFVHAAGAGIVVDQDSQAQLQAALQHLLTDAELRRSMGEAGRQAVARELSLDVFGKRLESLYRSVLKSTAQRAAVSGGVPA